MEFNFGFDETIEMLRTTVRQFAEREIAPIASAVDSTNQFPRELWPKLGELGLFGITVDEADGGSGLGYLAHCVAMEEISRASASVGLSYGAHSNLCVNQIRRFATAEQKSKWASDQIQNRSHGDQYDRAVQGFCVIHYVRGRALLADQASMVGSDEAAERDLSDQ